jgi:hypothetical protein
MISYHFVSSDGTRLTFCKEIKENVVTDVKKLIFISVALDSINWNASSELSWPWKSEDKTHVHKCYINCAYKVGIENFKSICVHVQDTGPPASSQVSCSCYFLFICSFVNYVVSNSNYIASNYCVVFHNELGRIWKETVRASIEVLTFPLRNWGESREKSGIVPTEIRTIPFPNKIRNFTAWSDLLYVKLLL